MSVTAILILLATGISFGVWITLHILRTLVCRANKSPLCQEIINKLIKYRSANYHLHLSGGDVKTASVTQSEESEDETLENALKQFGYQKGEIIKAITHVKDFQGTIGDKLKESLKYLGGNV